VYLWRCGSLPLVGVDPAWKALAPVFRPHLALRPPTALFLQGDEIDEWDGLSATLQIENMPTVKVLRGGMTCDRRDPRRWPNFRSSFEVSIQARAYGPTPPGRILMLKDTSLATTEVQTLATQPFEACHTVVMVEKRSESGLDLLIGMKHPV
jgi:hypothetical protein